MTISERGTSPTQLILRILRTKTPLQPPPRIRHRYNGIRLTRRITPPLGHLAHLHNASTFFATVPQRLHTPHRRDKSLEREILPTDLRIDVRLRVSALQHVLPDSDRFRSRLLPERPLIRRRRKRVPGAACDRKQCSDYKKEPHPHGDLSGSRQEWRGRGFHCGRRLSDPATARALGHGRLLECDRQGIGFKTPLRVFSIQSRNSPGLDRLISLIGTGEDCFPGWSAHWLPHAASASA